MSAPYYADDTITLYHGANIDVLPTLPAESVDCVVTSPPYFGLRSYDGGAQEYGTEKTLAEFVANLVATFREVRRVLAKDGTVWLNLGDSYAATQTASGTAAVSKTLGRRADGTMSMTQEGRVRAQARQRTKESRTLSPGVPTKNLLGMPWRVALALQDDGWLLRNAIVWAKPNTMPESVKDRLSTRYEHVFLLTRSPKYWFNLDGIREAHTMTPQRRGRGTFIGAERSGNGRMANAAGRDLRSEPSTEGHPLGRNPGDVWTIPTVPFVGAHFATYPPELVRRCIVAGCKPGGTVLDPFHGSGTTGKVAAAHGHKYVGIELNKDYLDLSLETRLANGTLNFDHEAL